MSAILPCPFCGSNDFKEKPMVFGLTRWEFITCKKCKCRMQHISKPLLYDAWNTRASPTRDWCPSATQELINCQKAYNELKDRISKLAEEARHHASNGHKELSAGWVVYNLQILL